MRDHAIFSPQFWTGETGRALRTDPDAQRVAAYLFTAPTSNMIGLYYLPILTIANDVGLSKEGASKALRRVCQLGFASYCFESEVVFVFEMARYQVGSQLSPKDKRVKGVERQLCTYRKCRFYNDFLSRYGDIYHLSCTPNPQSQQEAPSKPLRSQEQEQEQEQGIKLPSEACPNPPSASSDFAAFWQAVPKKVGKQAAAKAYKAAVKAVRGRTDAPGGDDPHGYLLDRMTEFAASEKAQGQFCPHPSTWLSQGRYDDDPATWRESRGSPSRIHVGPGQVFTEGSESDEF